MSTILVFDLLRFLWSKKLRVAAFTLLIGLIVAIWLLTIPNKYTSVAIILAENREQEGGLSSLASSFGSVASLAGINLGADSSAEVEAEYLITSYTFLLNIAMANDLLPDIVASTGYDSASDAMIYDPNLFDTNERAWIINAENRSASREIPARWIIEDSMKDLVSLAKDDETGLLTLRVEHYSPAFAQRFAQLILEEINRVMRDREITRIDKRLEFLELQLKTDMSSEIKQSLFSLIEQQLKQKMISQTNEDFIFRVIEPPTLPELKSSPLRALVLLISLIASGLAGLFYYTVRYVIANSLSLDQ